MKVSNILTGIEIFQNYGLSDYGISAEHDQIIVEYTSKPINELDLEVLAILGWTQPESLEKYSFDEHWVAQV